MSYPAGHQTERYSAGLIDLRSDTVTRPDAEMRAVIVSAEVGDDVYGDDPSVNALEQHAACLFGKDAAAFFPTGTQSNLAALLSHCGRGDEILVGCGYHIQKAEACGASVLGGIAIDPLDLTPDYAVAPETIRQAVKPDDNHFAITRLLCLENTVGGRVVSLKDQDAAVTEARNLGLKCHLDGARIFNACVALDISPSQIAQGFDTVSVCLSKGLGAPAGSVLCGDVATLTAAKRWRKMLGGGMRQSGLLAAAGHYALMHNVDALAQDHRRTFELAAALASLPYIEIELADVQTNMIWLRFSGVSDADAEAAFLAKGIIIAPSSGALRLVLHRDITDAHLLQIISAFQSIFPQKLKTGTAA